MRKYKLKELPFIAIVERTASGTPHLHILARVPWLHQKWLSEQMLELLDAPIVDIRRIDAHHRVAGYVAKYVGKDPHQFGTCKRYWKSQDYDQRPDRGKKPPRQPGVWYDRVNKRFHRWCSDMRQLGYVVTMLAPHAARCRPPDGGFYTVRS